MKKGEFEAALRTRLEENRRLSSKGGLPEVMAPVVYVVASYCWQVLAAVTTLVCVVGFGWWPEVMVNWVARILLAGG